MFYIYILDNIPFISSHAIVRLSVFFSFLLVFPFICRVTIFPSLSLSPEILYLFFFGSKYSNWKFKLNFVFNIICLPEKKCCKTELHFKLMFFPSFCFYRQQNLEKKKRMREREDDSKKYSNHSNHILKYIHIDWIHFAKRSPVKVGFGFTSEFAYLIYAYDLATGRT